MNKYIVPCRYVVEGYAEVELSARDFEDAADKAAQMVRNGSRKVKWDRSYDVTPYVIDTMIREVPV